MRALRNGLALMIASAVWLAASATIVLWPAATFGLVIVAMAPPGSAAPSPGAVLNGVRRHLRAIAVWGVVNAAILALMVALERDDLLAERLLPGVKIALQGAAIVWLGLQLYAVPLLLVQHDGRMLSAWRSAGLLALAAPASTLALGLLAALVVGAARMWPVPLLLFAPGLLAWLGGAAVTSHLRAYGFSLDPPTL